MIRDMKGIRNIPVLNKIHILLPHALFIFLVILVLMPSAPKVEKPYSFLCIIIIIETAILIHYKNKVAMDMGILIYIFLIIWDYLTAKAGKTDSLLYPPPENVFQIITADYIKILTGIYTSLQLLLIAFGIAIFVGVGLGLFVGISDRISGVVMPVVKIISPIPPIVYSPYAVALLPSFRAASVFVVTMTIFWPIFMNMVLSVRQIDKKIMDSAKTLNLKKSTLILHVLLPYSSPGILNSITVSISTSFLVLTAAEMIGATSGLGWYIKYYSDFANYTKVVAGIIVIGVVVSIINALLNALKKCLIRWR